MVQFFCLSFSKQAGITFTSAEEWLLNRRSHRDKTTLHFQCRSKEEASWTCLKHISFGSAVKAVKYFSFCFLRKLHCIACGLCLSSLGGAPASNKLSREEMLGSWKWVVWQREGFLQMPRWVRASKLSSHHLENSHEELEGSCQYYRDVMCDFKLPQTWHCWAVRHPGAVHTSLSWVLGWTHSRHEHKTQTTGLAAFDPSPDKTAHYRGCPGLWVTSCCHNKTCQNRLIDIAL